MASNKRRIVVNLTKEEYEEMMCQKKFMRLTTYSDLIRMYINNAVCFNVDFNGLFELCTQIARIGNNINQIAHAVNQTHSITPYQIQQLRDRMDEIDDKVAKATMEKGRIAKYIAREITPGGNLGIMDFNDELKKEYEEYRKEIKNIKSGDVW